MMKVIEYLKTYNETLNKDNLNDADLAVFAQISYFRLDKFFENKKEFTFSSHATLNDLNYMTSPNLEAKKSLKLATYLVINKRFKDVEITNYHPVFSTKNSIQYASMIFKITNDLYVIAFRGTDISINGWYESLMLSYSDSIPSHIEGLNYLKEVLTLIPSSARIYITGHSKGGNIAQWSFLHLNENEQKRIYKVYNFEGPGNREEYSKFSNYKLSLKKIKKFVTSDSIIGILLFDNQNFKVIKASGNNGVTQHSIFSWEISKTTHSLVLVDFLSKSAIALSLAIDKWLSEYSPSQTKGLIDSLFTFLTSCGIMTQKDFTSNFSKKARNMFNKYQKANSKEKNEFSKSINTLLKYFLAFRFTSYTKLKELYKKEPTLFSRISSNK